MYIFLSTIYVTTCELKHFVQNRVMLYGEGRQRLGLRLLGMEHIGTIVCEDAKNERLNKLSELDRTIMNFQNLTLL